MQCCDRAGNFWAAYLSFSPKLWIEASRRHMAFHRYVRRRSRRNADAHNNDDSSDDNNDGHGNHRRQDDNSENPATTTTTTRTITGRKMSTATMTPAVTAPAGPTTASGTAPTAREINAPNANARPVSLLTSSITTPPQATKAMTAVVPVTAGAELAEVPALAAGHTFCIAT